MDVHQFRSVALMLAAVAAAAAIVAGCGGSSAPNEASVSLQPVIAMAPMKGHSMSGMTEEAPSGMVMAPSSAHGSAHLTQKGDHLTGTITVSGLKPGSRHAEHLHGPDGSCDPKKMTPNMAVVLPDLVADAQGTAAAKVDFTVHQDVVGPGYFIMVHQGPTPASERSQIGSAPASQAFMRALSTNPGILCGDLEVSN